MTSPEQRFFCKTCGDELGEGMLNNVVYFCDRRSKDDDQWCGKCFDNKPCGRGEHGDACEVRMFCAGPSE